MKTVPLRHSQFNPMARVMVVFAVMALAAACAAATQQRPSRAAVYPGIDVLLTDSLPAVQGKRLGLVTNLAAVDAAGIGDISRIRAAGLKLVALFGPEHGLTVTAAPGERVASGVDSTTNIPIYSLYGQTRVPTPEMLRGIDLLLVDLPDVGARYFTYLATTLDVMRAAGEQGIPVVILDRPNPIGGTVEGNILDTLFRSSVGILAIPMRPGLTLAEGARLGQRELAIRVDLRVVPAKGWTRSMTMTETKLPFLPPSPNLQDLEALFHYPGLCLFEGTSLSVGRGTDAPFHQIGAAWLDTVAVLKLLREADLPGVRFAGVVFTPRSPGDGKSADTTVAGIRLIVTDERAYQPVRTALNLLAVIRTVHPDHFTFNASFDRLAGGTKLREALMSGANVGQVVASWSAGIESYRRRLAGLLLYP